MRSDKSKAEVWADMIEVSAPGAAAELRRLDAVNRELLEALQMALDHALFPSRSISEAGDKALAAIAKATDV